MNWRSAPCSDLGSARVAADSVSSSHRRMVRASREEVPSNRPTHSLPLLRCRRNSRIAEYSIRTGAARLATRISKKADDSAWPEAGSKGEPAVRISVAVSCLLALVGSDICSCRKRRGAAVLSEDFSNYTRTSTFSECARSTVWAQKVPGSSVLSDRVSFEINALQPFRL